MTIKRRRRPSLLADIEVPDIEVPDLDIPDIGGVKTEDLDMELFDEDEADDNTFTRYMRPKLYKLPSQNVRYDNARQLARDLKWDRDTPRYNCFVSGNFVFGDFIPAFLESKNCRAEEMTIATLSMSKGNVDSLRSLMDRGYLVNLTIIISAYFYSHERRDTIPYIYKKLDVNDNFQLVVAGVHTKTCMFRSVMGKKIVIHGSANLRSSQNIEEFTIEENAELYDFYAETYGILTEKYKTINKPVRSRESWDKMEKRLTAKSNPKTH